MTPTQAREAAISLAASDFEAALKAARAVSDPWFACQALAWVGRFAPENRVEPVLKEAIRAAWSAADPYRFASLAWPLRALIERDRSHLTEEPLGEFLRRSPSIRPPSSRSEALVLVFQAVFPAGRLWWHPVLVEIRDASQPVLHWRQARSIGDAVLIVAGVDPDLARAFAEGVQDDRARREIGRGWDRGEFPPPRPFFWDRAARS